MRQCTRLSHLVPLSDAAVDLLKGHRGLADGSEWVFPSPSHAGQHIDNVQKAAARVRAETGIADLVLHDLRRTAASSMTAMGISRLVVAKILNHVEQGVTQVYDRHSYDIEKRQALEVWAKRLFKIVSGDDNRGEEMDEVAAGLV